MVECIQVYNGSFVLSFFLLFLDRTEIVSTSPSSLIVGLLSVVDIASHHQPPCPNLGGPYHILICFPLLFDRFLLTLSYLEYSSAGITLIFITVDYWVWSWDSIFFWRESNIPDRTSFKERFETLGESLFIILSFVFRCSTWGAQIATRLTIC